METNAGMKGFSLLWPGEIVFPADRIVFPAPGQGLAKPQGGQQSSAPKPAGLTWGLPHGLLASQPNGVRHLVAIGGTARASLCSCPVGAEQSAVPVPDHLAPPGQGLPT